MKKRTKIILLVVFIIIIVCINTPFIIGLNTMIKFVYSDPRNWINLIFPTIAMNLTACLAGYGLYMLSKKKENKEKDA